jgi:hypothetical protein
MVVVLLGVVLAFVMAGPAYAAATPGSGDALVVLTGDAYVPADEVVNSVVVFDGAARIEGTVEESVVVFSGPVTVSGKVGQDVIAFDGLLVVTGDATVGGDVIGNELRIATGATIEGTDIQNAGFALGFQWASLFMAVMTWIAIAVSVLVLGLLLLWLAPRAADATIRAGRTAVGPAIGWGFALLIGLPVLAIVAIGTLIGLPLGLGLMLALALIFAIGQTTGAWFLGRMLIKTGSRVGAFALGWGILSVVSLVPGLGALVWLAATVYGLGMICVAAYRARRVPTEVVMAPAVPTPPIHA